MGETRSNNTLRIVISSDEISTTIKFHLLRTGEHWLTSNLEEYEEALLTLNSTNYHHIASTLKLSPPALVNTLKPTPAPYKNQN